MTEMGVGRCTGPQPLFRGCLYAEYMITYISTGFISFSLYLRSDAWVSKKNIKFFDLRLGHLVCRFFLRMLKRGWITVILSDAP